jgi:hypothetical protein
MCSYNLESFISIEDGSVKVIVTPDQHFLIRSLWPLLLFVFKFYSATPEVLFVIHIYLLKMEKSFVPQVTVIIKAWLNHRFLSYFLFLI